MIWHWLVRLEGLVPFGELVGEKKTTTARTFCEQFREEAEVGQPVSFNSSKVTEKRGRAHRVHGTYTDTQNEHATAPRPGQPTARTGVAEVNPQPQVVLLPRAVHAPNTQRIDPAVAA